MQGKRKTKSRQRREVAKKGNECRKEGVVK